MLVDGPIGLLTGLPVSVCFIDANGREWVRVLLFCVFVVVFNDGPFKVQVTEKRRKEENKSRKDL
jgi:hypothetical protein